MRRSCYQVETADAIAAFGDLWPSAQARRADIRAYVFQTREVRNVWVETIGRARKAMPIFVRVTADGAPVLLLALALERRHGARVLTFQDGGVSDYNAPVLFRRGFGLDQAQAPALWEQILARIGWVDAVAMEKIPADICGTPNPLARLAPLVGASGYCVQLEGDFRKFEQRLLHRPKDSRRKRRRLAEHGDLAFVVAETADDRARLLALMMRQKSRRYLERDGVDGFDRPGYRAYFSLMTERHAELVHLSALEVAGRPLATHWGLVTPDRFYCLMLGFEDDPLAQYSPGRLLVEDLIRSAYARGLATFDLGCGDAPWKSLVGANPAPLFRARSARSPLGWAYLNAAQMRRDLRAYARNNSGAIAVSGNARGSSRRSATSSQLSGK